MGNINSKLDAIINQAIAYAPKLALALLIIILGFWLSNKLVKVLAKSLKKREISEDVRPFIITVSAVLLKILIVISAAGIVGIETSSFVAVLAAAGFAVGMALQGSLSNFAAGVLILLFKPYKIGDIIELKDKKGKVVEIQIFNTVMQTVLNETVIIPNGLAISDLIVNHSSVGFIRVDVFGHIPYSEKFSKIERLILAEIAKNDKILKTPETTLGIETFDTHFINFGIYAFAKPENYWDVYYYLTRTIKIVLGENNIQVAYSEDMKLGEISKED
ncbi:MAG: mechanosensitive ion channel family protein [Chitinophagales bacterium]|nr:mechanosensitive ion channel family protein [Chitinophagales bacterium]